MNVARDRYRSGLADFTAALQAEQQHFGVEIDQATSESVLAQYHYCSSQKALGENPAPEQGNTSSQSRLGWMYLKGEGVQQNVTESLKWYRKAVELEETRPVQARAYLLRVEGLRRSNEMGSQSRRTRWGPAQFKIGYMYYKGQGVKQDYEEAAKWFIKDASRNSARAQLRIGFILSKGIGVPKDLRTSV